MTEEYSYFRNRQKPEPIEHDFSDADLMTVASTEEGYRVLLGILRQFEPVGYVSNDPASIAIHNQGASLLEELCRVCPTVAIRIIADLYGILKLN